MSIVGLIVAWFILKSIMGKDAAKSLMGKILLGFFGVVAVIGLFSALPALIIGGLGFGAFALFRNYYKSDERTRSKDYGWENTKSSASGSNPYEYKGAESQKYEGPKYSQAAQNYSSSFDDKTYKVVSAILPKSVKKRAELVNDFSEEFKLYLTPEQVDKIVNATYLSENWKKEVEAMNTKLYEVPSQWFQGPTKWLRTYLYAFAIQDVTSDWEQQQRIAQSAFEEVFKYSDTLENVTLEERIHTVNDKFYTQFDDVTFMNAYHYLESIGLNHNIDTTRHVYMDKAEEMEKKYSSLPS